jgi:hypothetical protein
MSSHSVSSPSALPHRPALKPHPIPASTIGVRLTFWTVGILLAAAQAWVFRFYTSADSVSYLDMSDGMLRDSDWHRLINGIWSPLYPFLVGLARRIFPVSAANEIPEAHLVNIGFFIFAFVCFEFFLQRAASRVRMFQRASAKPGVLVFRKRHSKHRGDERGFCSTTDAERPRPLG